MNPCKPVILPTPSGVGGSSTYSTNRAGHETIFSTNHLGHFLLTLLLLPALGRGARIINVSSEVHDPASGTPVPDPADALGSWPTSDAALDAQLLCGHAIRDESARVAGLRRYAQSKLANVLFTQQLALRVSGDLPVGLAERDEDADAAETARLMEALPRRTCALPHAASLRVLAFNPGMMLDSNFIASSVGWVRAHLPRPTVCSFVSMIRTSFGFLSYCNFLFPLCMTGRRLAALPADATAWLDATRALAAVAGAVGSAACTARARLHVRR